MHSVTYVKTKTMQTTTTPPVIALFIATALGAITHDTHLDQIATAALATASTAAIAHAADSLKGSDHTHVERAAFARTVTTSSSRGTLPKVQPKDDDRKYIQNRKLALDGGDMTASLWPSV